MSNHFYFILKSYNKQDVVPISTLDEVFSSMQASAARTEAENDIVTKGKCEGNLTSVDCATVISYISNNYVGATIKFVGKDTVGSYLVGIDNGTGHKVLQFLWLPP